MARKHKNRSELGEQTSGRDGTQERPDRSVTGPAIGEHIPENGSDIVPREGRTPGKGADGDLTSGDEGIDDRGAMPRESGKDMNPEVLPGNRPSERMQSEQSKRRVQRQIGREDREFGGKGGQQGGARQSEREGTGYRPGPERTNTEDSDSGNPLV